MDPKDLKTLLLMEAIDDNGCQSQRELSCKLNISLGLVNTFIKDLKIRGIFQTSKQSNNKMRYILSAKGKIEKVNLSKQYLAYSIHYYNEIKRRISDVLTKLEKDGKQEIVFYGTGEICEIMCLILCEHNGYNVKIIDDKKAGRTICGRKIYDEVNIEKLNFDAVVIMDFENFSAIRDKLIDKSIPPDKIFTIFNQQPYSNL
jgi:predicted transcriptional regulator